MAKFARLFNLSENVQILLTKNDLDVLICTDLFGKIVTLKLRFKSVISATNFFDAFNENSANKVRLTFLKELK
jgi:hypothetical protein